MKLFARRRTMRARQLGASLLPPMSPFVADTVFGELTGADVSTFTREDLAVVIDHALAGVALARASVDHQEHGGLEPLRDLVRRKTAWMLHLRHAVDEVSDALQNYPVILLKGAGLEQIHPAMSQRFYSDLDLLVPTHTMREISARLEHAGYEVVRSPAYPRDDPFQNVGHAVTLKRSDGLEIDLHRTVAPSLWGRRLSFERLHRESQPLAATTLRIPSYAHSTLITLLQLIHNAGLRLRDWRDLAHLVWGAEEPARRTIALEAERCSLTTPFFVAIFGASRFLGFPPGLRLSSEHLSPTELWRIENILRLRHRPTHGAVRMLGMPAGEALRFSAQYLWPDKGFLTLRVSGHKRSRLAWHRQSLKRLSNTLSQRPGSTPNTTNSPPNEATELP